MRGFFRSVMIAALLASATVVPGVASADPVEAAAKPAAKTAVRVQVVHANNSGTVDPELKPIMRQLQFTKFSGFSLLDSFPANLAVGGETTFQIAGGRRLKVKLVGRTEEQAKVRLQMFNDQGKLLDTTVSIPRNRAFMVAGPRYKDGKLVIAVRVKY